MHASGLLMRDEVMSVSCWTAHVNVQAVSRIGPRVLHLDSHQLGKHR